MTGSIVGIGFAVFGLAVKYLPIFPAAGEPIGLSITGGIESIIRALPCAFLRQRR